MIKNRLTLKQLEALVCVADTGTFRKAARILGTTQPNVSVRIAAIEKTLGVTVMHRDAGSIVLTDKGQDILAAARDVLRATETLVSVAGRRDLVEDRLRLGVTELVASLWLHRFLRALKSTYPAVRVELTVDMSYEIENLLSEGQLDLAIQTAPFRTKSKAEIPVGQYQYTWVSTPDLCAGLPQTPGLADIFKVGILTHGKHTLASVGLRKALTDNNLSVDRIVHSNSLTAALNMAVDGMGIALLPRELCKTALDAGHLIEITNTWSPEPLHFFARYDADRAPHFVKDAAMLAPHIAQGAV